jgi:predicted peroxiredoxin
VNTHLVVKVTAGTDSPERCAQAFSLAATAVASGVDTTLWLSGEAAWFAVPGHAAEFALPQSAPLTELLDAVLAGGRVYLCSQCAARRGIAAEATVPGITIAGIATFLEQILQDSTQAVVY